MEDELIDLLVEDLTALSKILCSEEALPPSYVRINASSILRKWLLDGLLSKLSSFTGATYSLKTYETSDVVEIIKNNNQIQFYLAGGIMLDGIPMRGFYVSDNEAPPDGKLEIPKTQLKLFTQSQFLKSKRSIPSTHPILPTRK